MSAQVIVYKPSKYLEPFVKWYWEGSFNGLAKGLLSQRIIPNGFIELIIHLTDLHCDLFNYQGWTQSPDYTIIGLHSRPYEVHFPCHVKVFAIRFKPEGIYNIFGVPAAKFKEGYEDIALVLGTNFRDFCDRIREQTSAEQMIQLANNYFTNIVRQRQIDLSYVNYAAELIRQTKGLLRIDEIPDKIYISQRQLEREFKSKLGMSPKQYLRISRMNEVHRLLEENQQLNLTEIAYLSGYSDQAHFIKDFKNITGAIPTIFIKDRNQYVANSDWSPNIG